MALSLLFMGSMRFTLTVSGVLLLCLSAAKADFASDVVREMNFARTSPSEYADLLEARMRGYSGCEGSRAVLEAVRFLRRTRPLPPFETSEGLESGALLHVNRQGPTGRTGHGRGPSDRVSNFGRWLGCIGENIYYGRADAREVVMALIVDDGVRGRGHRKNIFESQFRVAGAATGRHAKYGQMCVIDFAGGFAEGGSQVADRVARAWVSPLGTFVR